MTAVRFSVAHSQAYINLRIDEEEANRRFADMGRSIAEVLQQATPIDTSGATPSHLDGPATDNSAEISVGQAVLGEDEDAAEQSSCAAEGHAGAMPEPASMADLPDLGLFCAASDLSSADTDVERVMRELAAKVEIVRDLASRSDNPGQVMEQVGQWQNGIFVNQFLKQGYLLYNLDLIFRYHYWKHFT